MTALTRRPHRLVHLGTVIIVLLLVVGGLYRYRRLAAPSGPRHLPLPPVMGTQASLTLWVDEATCQQAAITVAGVFADLDQRFSCYRPESEVSRLNASAAERPFACSPQLWQVLDAARAAYRDSQGGFDVSIGPLMTLWGFHRRRETVPPPAEVAQARAAVGLAQVRFDDQAKTVFFTRPGMALDFGGIVKGFAVDVAAEKLRAMGIRRGVVDLGGNLYCFAEPPPGKESYVIGVRDPRAPRDPGRLLAKARLRAQAIATSGDYERFVVLGGKRYPHIMDPRTGYPVAGMASVSVAAPTALATDVLSTSIFVNHGVTSPSIPGLGTEVQVLIVRADDQGTLSIEQHGTVWTEVGLPAVPAPATR